MSGTAAHGLGMVVITAGTRWQWSQPLIPFLTMEKDLTQKIGKKLVFCRYVRRNGKIYFPRKRQVFMFWVER